MQYALHENNLILPTPNISAATCPQCKTSVLAKCGKINIHHWAHESLDCDPWYEPESEWHRGWKAYFPREMTEVTMGPHRADIRTPSGTVIELQHSSISVDEIIEREQFYKDMIWIFDARKWHIYLSSYRMDGCPNIENKYIIHSQHLYDGYYGSYIYPQCSKEKCIDDRHHFTHIEAKTFRTFTWKWPRKTINSCQTNVFFHLRDDTLLHVVEMPSRWREGYGYITQLSGLIRAIKESK